MKVIIFGATGMVGQGVLRECLLDPAVKQVLTVGRQGRPAATPDQTAVPEHPTILENPDIARLGRGAGARPTC